MRTLQTRTADMHDCQLDCQLGSVVQHRRAPDRTLSSHKQSPRYALRRNGAPPGGLPLSLLALSHQPVVTHSNYTCAMLASPAHHAPRLDASRRTPGALHPEPEFNVSGHFADELLFYFLIFFVRGFLVLGRASEVAEGPGPYYATVCVMRRSAPPSGGCRRMIR